MVNCLQQLLRLTVYELQVHSSVYWLRSALKINGTKFIDINVINQINYLLVLLVKSNCTARYACVTLDSFLQFVALCLVLQTAVLYLLYLNLPPVFPTLKNIISRVMNQISLSNIITQFITSV
jgi:hypothetical protein